MRCLTPLLIVVASALTGCGGLNPTAGSFQGVYTGTYSRSTNGTAILAVDGSGNATVNVYDGSNGTYYGSGSVDATGVGTIAATNGTGAITVVATVNGTGNGSLATVATTGDFTSTTNAGYIGDGTTNPFNGSYTGTVAGSVTASFTMNIDNSGNVLLTVNDASGSYTGSGTLNNAGRVNFSATGTSAGVTTSYAFVGGVVANSPYQVIGKVNYTKGGIQSSETFSGVHG